MNGSTPKNMVVSTAKSSRVYVRTSASDCRLDKGVEFFVATDGKLKMTRGDTLNSQILRCIAYAPLEAVA